MRILDKIYNGQSTEISVDMISISIDELPFVMAEYIEDNNLAFDKEVDIQELSDFLGMRVTTHTLYESSSVFELYSKL